MKKPREMRECPLCGVECAVRGGGFTHHMKWHERVGDLGIVNKELHTSTEVSIIERGGAGSLDDMLRRLLEEGVVALACDSPKIFPKSRIGKQVLFISMGRLYGDPRGIVFGLSGGGCEICKINDLRVTQLIRIGLPADMARAIVETLRPLLKLTDVNTE